MRCGGSPPDATTSWPRRGTTSRSRRTAGCASRPSWRAYDGDDPVLATDTDWVAEMAARAERTIEHERAFAEQGVEPQRTRVADGGIERQRAEVAWLRATRTCSAGSPRGDVSLERHGHPRPRTMRERMLAGELYIADDPELGRMSRGPRR